MVSYMHIRFLELYDKMYVQYFRLTAFESDILALTTFGTVIARNLVAAD